MPAQKRLYENTDEDLPENNHENHQEQQQQQGEESDRSASSSSGRDQDEFILVRLPDIRKEVQCPICLGIIKKTRTVMECLHRFCRECIDKSMRMGNNECPACRTHCASRRSLRDDPNYDALIAALFPNIDQYEEEELVFHEEEKARNNQIQALIAQTFQRQSEALSKKRRRSQGILRRRRNYRFDDDDDANANDASKDSFSAVEPIAGLNSSVAASEAAREEPAASALELAREELAATMDETDAFLDRILDEAAACSAREGAPGSSSPTPPPAGPGLESRPVRPYRKTCEPRRLASAVSREMEQRERIIADREAEIAWLEAKLAASGGELREQTAALEAVMAGVEAENVELKAENVELKVEVARLKEEDDRLKASNKRLADRAAAAENELATRMSLHEVGGALHARLLEGLNIGRRIARLIVPNFPVEFINQRNRTAQSKEDLEGEPRDSQGGPPPL